MTRFSGFGHSKLSTRLGASATVMVLCASLSGCGIYDSYNSQISDSWAVTYEVSVSGETINAITNVSYLESPGRGQPGSPVEEEIVPTTNDIKQQDLATWSVQSIVTAEEIASVAATPPEGTTATCRILLDGQKAIATQTGALGEPVQCSATAPAFER